MKLAIAGAVALVLLGCTREPSGDAAPVGTLDPAAKPTPPVDHLAPGELIEGNESALGLKLPRALKTTLATNARVLAEGRIEAERVANYVRARVKDGKMTVGASSTLFEGVHLPAEPKRLLGVKIDSWHGVCSLEVWDMSPQLPTEPDPGSDAERWKKAGFNPDGTPLDPTHLK